jgi:hypothetical protein
VFVFFWLLFAVAVGFLASNRGRSGFGWFLIAALLSPLIGAVFLLLTKDLAQAGTGTPSAPTDATHVKCPACAEWVLPEATVCKHCGGPLVPAPYFQEKANDLKRKTESVKQMDNLAMGITFVFAALLLVALLSLF